MWFVYILKCKDGSLYTGITDNLARRFSEHKNGMGSRYTRSHIPMKILFSEKQKTKSDALKREAYIKSLRREEKLQLIHRIP